MNMVEALKQEVTRNKELLVVYQGLPKGAGAFGAMMIEAEITAAEEALASGDAVEIIKAYYAMKDTE